MVEILGAELPSINFGGLGNSSTWIIIGAILLILVAGIIFIWLIYRARIFNKKIVVFENIAGMGFQPVYKDKARLIKVGDGGEELLYLSKKKVYRTAYGKKMGKNTYWFAVGQDGYWYNVVLGDLDAKMGMLDIEPIDRDMRYMHVAVRKNIQSRYRKIKFMEKYGTIVLNSIFLVIMLLGVAFIIDKMGDVMASLNTAIETTKQVMDSNKAVLVAIDNICTGGSGLITG